MATLNGKSALVLGGVGGIGKATITSLLDAGVNRLGVIDIVEDGGNILADLLTGHKDVQFIYDRCGVEDESKLRVVIKNMSQKLDGFDVVVNSVGILNEQDPKSTIMINLV